MTVGFKISSLTGFALVKDATRYRLFSPMGGVVSVSTQRGNLEVPNEAT